jgi:hypothetical protein
MAVPRRTLGYNTVVPVDMGKRHRGRALRWLVALTALVAVPRIGDPLVNAHPAFFSKYTFHGQVRAILARHCASCHGSARVAAMSFDRYADTRPWAIAIKEEVLERRMPPWPAHAGFHPVRNDPSLTSFEREVLVEWIEGGAPEGDPRPASADDADLASSVGGGDSGGDVVLRLPPRTAARTQEVSLRPDLGGRKWLASWAVTPEEGGALAEVRLYAGRRLLGTWHPVSGRVTLPACVGQALEGPLRARLAFSKAAATGESPGRLRLGLLDVAPAMTVRLRSLAVDERLVNELTLFGVQLPSRATVGGVIELRASFPDGRVDVLGVFSPMGAHPAADLRFEAPITLPAGTELHRAGDELQVLVGPGRVPPACGERVSEGAPPLPSTAR